MIALRLDTSRYLDQEMARAIALTRGLPEVMQIAAVRARVEQSYEVAREMEGVR